MKRHRPTDWEWNDEEATFLPLPPAKGTWKPVWWLLLFLVVLPLLGLWLYHK